MTLALHWFRTDLRIYDNIALALAQKEGAVAGMYIATPRQWQIHNDAPIKQDYWRRNLQCLEEALWELGIPLHYFAVATYADIPALFEKILTVWPISALHCNREYPLNERNRDAAVEAVCNRRGVRLHLHDGEVLVPPDLALNKSGQPYKIFSPFARRMRELLQPASVPQPLALRNQQVTPLKQLEEQRGLHELGWPAPSPEWESEWPAGERRARQQLEKFCDDALDDYQTARNMPALTGTSRLSPALAAGVLAIRHCWQAAQLYGGPGAAKGAEIWRSELLWRDFYKHIVWHYPHVSQHKPWRADVGHVPWQHDEDVFMRWCYGKTGIPIVDAGMRQLVNTGWMHNRLRMLTAMFLTKHLLIDWHWGERWFMQHLVDGDFAANNGGWQWSASTGTDAVPYFRIFNPVTQSRRFDPDAVFIRRYLPELAHLDNRTIHDPGLARPASYPAPIVDLAFGRDRALRAFRP